MPAQTCSTCGRTGSMRIGVLPDGRATEPCPDICHDIADRAWMLVGMICQLHDTVKDAE